jgi:hypothetical protein
LKPLLCIFQFRQIPQFLESVKDLSCDKLWIKFYPQREAYNLARGEFIKRTEYSHFLLLTDDVIVQQKDIDQLCGDAEHCEIISAWFNGNLTDHTDDTNFSYNLPPDPPCKSTYEGYNFEKIKNVERWQSVIPGAWRLEVLHQGTALTLISRKIIEQVPFRHSEGCCIDSCLSLDLAEKGIKQYVDLRVRTLHLKISDDMQQRISVVGKIEPSIEYRPN